PRGSVDDAVLRRRRLLPRRARPRLHLRRRHARARRSQDRRAHPGHVDRRPARGLRRARGRRVPPRPPVLARPALGRRARRRVEHAGRTGEGHRRPRARPARQHRSRGARRLRRAARESRAMVRPLRVPRGLPGEPRVALRARGVLRRRRGLMDDKLTARLALVERQRRFEWNLARDVQAKAAAALLKGRTHALLNLIQVIDLATHELERRCDGDALELVRDLKKTAEATKVELAELVALATPAERARGTNVAVSVRAAIEAVRPVAPELVVTVRLPIDTTTALGDEELQQLVFGLVLDGSL